MNSAEAIQIARSFVSRYPLTLYMGEAQIDYRTATLRQAAEVAVALWCDETLQDALLAEMVGSTQFVSWDNGRLVPHPVRYILCQNKETNSAVLDSLALYSQALEEKECYLPLLPPPCAITRALLTHELVSQDLQQHLPKDAYCFIVLGEGHGREEARALLDAMHSKGYTHCQVFYLDTECTDCSQETGGIHAYGQSDTDLAKMMRMAKARNGYYARQTWPLLVDEDSMWNRLSVLQQTANIHGILSIRSKLHLMELDCVPKNGIDVRAYEQVYAAGDAICRANGHVCYSNQMTEQGVRYTMAVLEHQRWVASMIVNGIMPAPLAEIVCGHARGECRKKHSSICTFDAQIGRAHV